MLPVRGRPRMGRGRAECRNPSQWRGEGHDIGNRCARGATRLADAPDAHRRLGRQSKPAGAERHRSEAPAHAVLPGAYVRRRRARLRIRQQGRRAHQRRSAQAGLLGRTVNDRPRRVQLRQQRQRSRRRRHPRQRGAQLSGNGRLGRLRLLERLLRPGLWRRRFAGIRQDEHGRYRVRQGLHGRRGHRLVLEPHLRRAAHRHRPRLHVRRADERAHRRCHVSAVGLRPEQRRQQGLRQHLRRRRHDPRKRRVSRDHRRALRPPGLHRALQHAERHRSREASTASFSHRRSPEPSESRIRATTSRTRSTSIFTRTPRIRTKASGSSARWGFRTAIRTRFTGRR